MILLPVFSAASCIMLVMFSLSDSVTRQERRLKRVTICYFSATGMVWFSLFIYNFYPGFFLWLNVALLFCFLVVPVLFYHIMYLLTTQGDKQNFPLWHYVTPVVLSLVLFVWSIFITPEIQLEIVTGRAHYIPPGYEAYGLFFISKPLLRLIIGVIYFFITLRILSRYYKKANTPSSLVRKPARWVIYLMVLLFMTLVATLLTAAIPRGYVLQSLWTLLAVIAVIGQHLLFTYHIVRRLYLLYVIHTVKATPGRETALTPSGGKIPQRRQHDGEPLTRKKIETYFRNEKPYVNPDFKITDLVERFDLNRSAISGFINQAYGVNFNRFVNRWRLEELERLCGLSSNRGKKKSQLLQKAGFVNMKHYQRSLRAEEAGQSDDPEKTESNE